MKITKLKAANINSLATQFMIDFESGIFERSKLFSICGANGVGKSSILDAICLALYDKCPRIDDVGNKKDTINGILKSSPLNILTKGKKEAFAEVEFIGIDSYKYVAVWELKKKIKNTHKTRALYRIDQDGNRERVETKGKEIDVYIKELIGLSWEQFRLIVILPQGKFEDFISKNSADKVKILEELFNLKEYDVIEQRVSALHKYLYTDVKNELENNLRNYTELVNADEIERLYTDQEILNKDIDSLNSILSNISKNESFIQRFNKTVDSLIEIQGEYRDLKNNKYVELNNYKEVKRHYDLFNQNSKSYNELNNNLQRKLENEKTRKYTEARLSITEDSLLVNNKVDSLFKFVNDDFIKFKEKYDLEKERAIVLDNIIQNTIEHLKGDNQKLDSKVNEIKNIDAEIISLNNDIEKINKEKQSIEEFLKNNQEFIKYININENLKLINNDLNNIINDFSKEICDKSKYKQEKLKIINSVIKLEEDIESINNNLVKNQERLLNELASLQCNDLSALLNKGQQLGELNRSIKEDSQDIVEISNKANDIKNVLVEIKNKLFELQQLQVQCNKEKQLLENIKIQLEELDVLLSSKQNDLNYLNSINKYLGDSKKLMDFKKDNKPCPLCGSIHYDETTIKLVQETNSKYEECAKEVSELENQSLKLRESISDIEKNINQTTFKIDSIQSQVFYDEFSIIKKVVSKIEAMKSFIVKFNDNYAVKDKLTDELTRFSVLFAENELNSKDKTDVSSNINDFTFLELDKDVLSQIENRCSLVNVFIQKHLSSNIYKEQKVNVEDIGLIDDLIKFYDHEIFEISKLNDSFKDLDVIISSLGNKVSLLEKKLTNKEQNLKEVEQNIKHFDEKIQYSKNEKSKLDNELQTLDALEQKSLTRIDDLNANFIVYKNKLKDFFKDSDLANLGKKVLASPFNSNNKLRYEKEISISEDFNTLSFLDNLSIDVRKFNDDELIKRSEDDLKFLLEIIEIIQIFIDNIKQQNDLLEEKNKSIEKLQLKIESENKVLKKSKDDEKELRATIEEKNRLLAENQDDRNNLLALDSDDLFENIVNSISYNNTYKQILSDIETSNSGVITGFNKIIDDFKLSMLSNIKEFDSIKIKYDDVEKTLENESVKSLSIDDYNIYINKIENLINSLVTKVRNRVIEDKSKKEEIANNIKQLEDNYEQLLNQIKTNEEDFDLVLSELKTDKAEFESVLSMDKSELNKIEEYIKEAQNSLTSVSDRLNIEFGTLKSIYGDYQEYISQLNSQEISSLVEYSSDDLFVKVKGLDIVNKNDYKLFEIDNGKLTEYRDLLTVNIEKLEKVKSNIAVHENNKIQIEELNKKLEQLDDNKNIALIRKLYYVIVDKKFKYHILENIFAKLIYFANNHLRELTDAGFSMDWVRTTTSNETEFKNLDFVVKKNNGESLTVNQLSGGQKFIISLALALSLSQVCGVKTSISNFFVDEGFGCLSGENISKVLEGLTKNKHINSNRLIGIISHTDMVKDNIKPQIIVHALSDVSDPSRLIEIIE